MKKNILFQEPYKSNKVKKYVNQSLNSNYYTADYFEDKCKDLLKNKFGLKNTFITHSATGALEMAALLTKENKKAKSLFTILYIFIDSKCLFKSGI